MQYRYAALLLLRTPIHSKVPPTPGQMDQVKTRFVDFLALVPYRISKRKLGDFRPRAFIVEFVVPCEFLPLVAPVFQIAIIRAHGGIPRDEFQEKLKIWILNENTRGWNLGWKNC